MSTWLTIPSGRPAPEAQACIDKWRAAGYKTAIWRDPDADPVDCDYLRMEVYPGYAMACNALIRDVLAMDPECSFVVTGGDDTDPDPTKRADEIAKECRFHFGLRSYCHSRLGEGEEHESSLMSMTNTFGVMQPTGDRFADGSIDRIAGSPWIGREFCERMYGGKGPYFSGYTHCFVDEELQLVAQKLGVFWQRRDLTHLHHHFMRQSDAIDSPAVGKPTPPHLIEATSPAHWSRYQAMFLGRKAAGFPGFEPVSAADSPIALSK